MSKALFFDIDGTLVSFKTHAIPDSARKAIKQLREKGHKVFIATGRPKLLINNLGDLEFDGFITMNGAHCFTLKEGDIYRAVIPKEDIERLISYFSTHDYPFVCISDNDWFITHCNEAVEEICRLIEIGTPPIAPIETARNKEVLEMMGYFPKEMDDDIFNHVLTHCNTLRWHPLFSDIVQKGVSKSTGIDKVIAHYNIKLEDTIAFGDGGNDIPMLKHAGIGIAMGNASERVQSAADFVTDTVDNDGIAQALKHFQLID